MPLYSSPNVTSSLWSGSVFQPGAVLQDIEVIRQRMYLAINTPLGSDPLRPLFGSKIYQYADRPLLIAAANIKSEIIDALTLWVPEVSNVKVSYVFTGATVKNGIQFTVNSTWGTTTLPPIVFGVNRASFAFAGLNPTLIVDAPIPYNRDGSNYNLKFTVNGSAATPAAVSGGYDSMADALAWAKANWGSYGNWGLGKDLLVVYMGRAFNNGSLTIGLI